MIKDIQELNFPSYATMSAAKVSLPDMGEWNITSQIKIDGQIAPDFSFDWEVVHDGHKYIMPLRIPAGSKDNQKPPSVIYLTFQHWAIWQLKRFPFVTMQPIDSGTAVADEEVATVSLNLGDLVILFGQVLKYYYGDKITIQLNPDWQYKAEAEVITISHTKVWDVLIEVFHKQFGVRWAIEPNGGYDKYVIKVGYPTTEQSHIFEYGFEGGLMKVERQVQSEEIRNLLKGRGGEKNLPYRYFKNVDPENPTFKADPDWIEELANIYFGNLMPATFRSYVQGWKAAHISKYPGYTAVLEENAYAPWAYRKGFTDTKFHPVEFVADEITINPEVGDRYVEILPGYTPAVKKGSSLDKYGPLMDSLDNNDEIYPTIQGVTVDPYGRIDEVVEVEPITSDDIEEAVENDAQINDIPGSDVKQVATSVAPSSYATIKLPKVYFKVPTGKTANLFVNADVLGATLNGRRIDILNNAEKEGVETVNVYNSVTGQKRSASGIPEGSYYFEVEVEVHNLTTDKILNITAGTTTVKLNDATPSDKWANKWHIWVKNIWGTTKLASETPEQYAKRVWEPILGDRIGNEAKVVFASGLLAHEDYEFVITSIPKYDPKECTWETVENGQVVEHEYWSEWCIELGKNDAELETLGVYLPSVMRQAKAGDFFFFIGIDMPHQYTVWNEIRIDDDWKKPTLGEKKDIKPTWVVQTDRVRLNNEGKPDALIRLLHPGDTLRLADKRFIEGDYETLYLSSLTITYREPTSDDAALNPDVEIVLSDRYEVSANPVATVQGEVSALAKQVGSISNIEQIVRAIGDKLYLRKDGISDRSLSPTEFASLLTSTNFRKGIVGGKGWGFFKDENGNWALETDRINVRQDMEVNNLVVNQVVGQGGTYVESAAQMEITRVEELDKGYKCYFDQHEGTVANLFHIGDIAWNNRFTAENNSLKYYKRRVTEIGEDYVVLTKPRGMEDRPAGWPDSGVNGSGVPAEGDAIVQFGSYTDAERQYAKVRDVIGGGYVRNLQDLDSVNAEGKEYFFAGRQSGMYNGRPRLFIGDLLSYLEYINGILRFKGAISAESLIGDETINGFIDRSVLEQISKYTGGAVNLLRNSDFRNPFDDDWEATALGGATWTLNPLVLSVYKGEGRRFGVSLGSGGQITLRQDLSGLDLSGVTALTFSLYAGRISIYDNATISARLILKSTTEELISYTFSFGTLTPPYTGNRVQATVDLSQFSKTAKSAMLEVQFTGSGSAFIQDLMLETGGNNIEWVASPLDNQYLRKALQESATLAGGLILGSLMMLGETDSDGKFNVTAGVNGVVDENVNGKGVAIWAGGPHTDAATNGGGAAMAFRHDGTGYASNNIIRFEKDHVAIGANDMLKLFPDGLYMLSKDASGNLIPRMKIVSTPVSGDVLSVSSGSTIIVSKLSIDGSYSAQNNTWVSFDELPIVMPINGGYVPNSGYINSGSITMVINALPGGSVSPSMGFPKLRVGVRLVNATNYTDYREVAFTNPGNATLRATVTLNSSVRLYIPSSGAWELVIDVVNVDGAYPSYNQKCTASINGNVTLKLNAAAGMTTIGTNGLSMEFPGGAFKFFPEYCGARIGNMVFEMSDTKGIRVSKKGGDGTDWKQLI